MTTSRPESSHRKRGPVITVRETPVIRIHDRVFSADECAHIIELASPELDRAVVSGGDAGVKSAGRTGSVKWLRHNVSPVVSECTQRLADIVGMSLVNAESLQVIHYAQNQEYKPHFDAWEHDTERGIRCMKRGGQRLVTCLVYLNDEFKGGGTVFPKLDTEVQPRQGRMVLFENCGPGTNIRDDTTLHGGSPVIEGEKWACNLWFRENEFI